MDCIFCNRQMQETGFNDYTCLNHSKNIKIRAYRATEGTIFTRVREEAILVKDGKKIKMPLSKAILVGASFEHISNEMKKIIDSFGKYNMRKLKRHAIVLIF